VPEYILLLRPIPVNSGVKVHYLLFNEFWEIDSMSLSLHELLKITPQEYQEA
jgi:hypothetical protein